MEVRISQNIKTIVHKAVDVIKVGAVSIYKAPLEHCDQFRDFSTSADEA